MQCGNELNWKVNQKEDELRKKEEIEFKHDNHEWMEQIDTDQDECSISRDILKFEGGEGGLCGGDREYPVKIQIWPIRF